MDKGVAGRNSVNLHNETSTMTLKIYIWIIMKQIITCLGVALLCVTAGCGGSRQQANPDSAGRNLEQRIQECSRIYTSEYQVSKIIVHRDEKRIKGKLLGLDVDMGIAGGKRIIAIPLKGVLRGYVDMSDIDSRNVLKRGDSIEIVLPDPRIELTGTEISADEIREKVGLLQSRFGDEDLTRIQQMGRDSLIAEIPDLGIIADARQSAARTLIALLSSMGYDESKITIRFNHDERSMSAPAAIRDMITTTIQP